MRISTSVRHLLAVGASVLVSVLACGGTSPEPASAEQKSDQEERPARDAADGASSESDADESAAPQKASCDDGTCIVCGEAQCPAGWYCDESAKGGPACGWLPECAKKPTCACLKRVFSGGCEERNGGLYVKE